MSVCTTFGGKPKVKHLNKPDAIKHAIEYQRFTIHKVDIYRCRHCRYWHVGRKPPTKKLRGRLRRGDKMDEEMVGKLIEALRATLPKRMQ